MSQRGKLRKSVADLRLMQTHAAEIRRRRFKMDQAKNVPGLGFMYEQGRRRKRGITPEPCYDPMDFLS
jgi:hypothetical protein